MLINQNTNNTYTLHQLKLPLEIEKLCRNDTRSMYLRDRMKATTFATFGNIQVGTRLDESTFVYSSGHRKSIHQRQYRNYRAIVND